MKRIAALAAAMMLLAAPVFAEEHHNEHTASQHRLLVTDVPDPGQVEARLDYVYSYARGKNDLDEVVKDEISGAVARLGVGVVKGLKLSAGIPYTFVQHMENNHIEGWGDLTLGARYAVSKAVHMPFDLAVGLDWQLNTASTNPGKPGQGANIYSPYLAVSKNYGNVIPYIKYQPDLMVKNVEDRKVHNVTVGAEVELTHRLSFDASVKTSVKGGVNGIDSSTDVELELTPYINIAKNTYLLPVIAYKFIGDVKTDFPGLNITLLKDAYEIRTGLGIYFLF